jgi:thymidylate kinase
MRDTRFLIIEGIMGSGKTTTATYLTEQMRRRGMPAQFLAEGPTLDEPEHP